MHKRGTRQGAPFFVLLVCRNQSNVPVGLLDLFAGYSELASFMKSTLVLVFVIVFGFSQRLQSQSLKDLSFGTDSTLEVITWNIEWFPKNGDLTADSVSKILLALNADVYALQEIGDSTAFNNMMKKVDGYRVRFDRVRHGGLAYVYKSSLTNLKFYNVFGSQDYRRPFPRAPFVMEFTFDDEKYHLVNNHWKCCGNGRLESDEWDEEQRRKDANDLLKQYIDRNWAKEKAMLLGDLNDILTDRTEHNVFASFLNDGLNYRFADLDIAKGPKPEWSYPGWPSHLDHILISNELFKAFESPGATIQTLAIEDYLKGGFSEFDRNISDHRPVALKLPMESIVSNRPWNYETNTEFKIHLDDSRQMKLEYQAQGAVSVQIFDVHGKSWFQKRIVVGDDNLSIKTESWPIGLYIAVVYHDGAAIVRQKFILSQ